MKTPDHVLEIFLQPGEWYFGDRNTRIRTILGSCVSLTIWHPRLLIGGMCHYMLPTRSGGIRVPALDGRYADDAVALLLREIRAAGTQPEEYELKMFGGGNMFPALKCLKDRAHVPYKNAEVARKIAALHGFRMAGEHLGSAGHRNVIFDIWSGYVWLKHHSVRAGSQCDTCEQKLTCEAR